MRPSMVGVLSAGGRDQYPVSRFYARPGRRYRSGRFVLCATGAGYWSHHAPSLGVTAVVGAVSAETDWVSVAQHREFAGLRGIFALVHWEPRSQQLVLATDHRGRRPIYYTHLDGAFCFATRLTDLLALPGVASDLDEAHLAAFVADTPVGGDSTFYRDIRRLPPASYMVVTAEGASTVHEYWQPDWERRLRFSRDEDYVEEARRLLDQAVRRCLPTSGPVVCHLSGGLDSGAVAATAARLSFPSPIHALTLHPPEGVERLEPSCMFSDERAHAATVAAMHPNMRWVPLASDGLGLYDKDPSMLFHSAATPFRNIMNVAWFTPAIEHARALGAQVILGAGYGNLTLSWEGLPLLPALARKGRWQGVWHEARALARARQQPLSSVLRGHVLSPLLPTVVRQQLNRWRGQSDFIPPYSPINPAFADEQISQRRLSLWRCFDLSDSQSIRQAWLRRSQTGGSITASLEEVTGVEIRDPMADIDLLEFCFAVPDAQYLRHGTTRWLARRTLADRLPPLVINETRRGYQCPEFFHRMCLKREAIEEDLVALESSPLATRILDVARMKQLVRSWPENAAEAHEAGYMVTLHRGLHIGEFLRWVEGANR